ncbi:MAG: MBL fold metallo-hydrolase [Candidatus Hodarchaeota archaeon]
MKVFSDTCKLSDGVYMIDANGWGVEKSTSVLAIIGKQTAIIETADSNSAARILDTLRDLEIDLDSVGYIIPTHRHTDHAGGAAPLAKALSEATVYGHQYTIDIIRNPAKMNQAVVEMFGEYAIPMEALDDESRFVTVRGGETIELGNDLVIEIIHTPGHTSDHISLYEMKNKIMYCGDAAGILNFRNKTIVPSTLPPSFKFKPYVSSLEKMLDYELNAVTFAHFGTVMGKEADKILRDGIETVEEWMEVGEEAWKDKGDVEAVIGALKLRYEDRLGVFHPAAREIFFDILGLGIVGNLSD